MVSIIKCVNLHFHALKWHEMAMELQRFLKLHVCAHEAWGLPSRQPKVGSSGSSAVPDSEVFLPAAFVQLPLSLRFAVGTGDGVILVYDLRTATKWRVFEVHVWRLLLLRQTGFGWNSGSAQWFLESFRFKPCLNSSSWGAGSQRYGGWVGVHARCCPLSIVGELRKAAWRVFV